MNQSKTKFIAFSILLLFCTLQSCAENKQPIEISVQGVKGKWIFKYSNGFEVSSNKNSLKKSNKVELPVFTIPINQKIEFTVSSKKVNRTLAFPAFATNIPVKPGTPSHGFIVATKLGSFVYTCLEACGEGHFDMVGKLKVVSEDEFKKFMKKNKPLKENKVSGE